MNTLRNKIQCHVCLTWYCSFHKLLAYKPKHQLIRSTQLLWRASIHRRETKTWKQHIVNCIMKVTVAAILILGTCFSLSMAFPQFPNEAKSGDYIRLINLCQKGIFSININLRYRKSLWGHHARQKVGVAQQDHIWHRRCVHWSMHPLFNPRRQNE